jgi:hypothetical protein
VENRVDRLCECGIWRIYVDSSIVTSVMSHNEDGLAVMELLLVARQPSDSTAYVQPLPLIG